MAAANGNGHGHLPDTSALLGEAGEITDAARLIARLADEVSAGADAQARSLDNPHPR